MKYYNLEFERKEDKHKYVFGFGDSYEYALDYNMFAILFNVYFTLYDLSDKEFTQKFPQHINREGVVVTYFLGSLKGKYDDLVSKLTLRLPYPLNLLHHLSDHIEDYQKSIQGFNLPQFLSNCNRGKGKNNNNSENSSKDTTNNNNNVSVSEEVLQDSNDNDNGFMGAICLIDDIISSIEI